MPTTNRILLARGPNGSNLDQIFDVDIKSNEQNILKLKSNYDLSANVKIGRLEEANLINLVISGSILPANANVSIGSLENPIKDLFVSADTIHFVGEEVETTTTNASGEEEIKKERTVVTQSVEKDPTTGESTVKTKVKKTEKTNTRDPTTSKIKEGVEVVISEVEGVGGGGGPVNEAKQTFIELLTQQPNKFTKEDLIAETSAKIDISWNYNDIIPKHKDVDIIAKMAHIADTTNRLPYISEICFDISSADTTDWENWPEKTMAITNADDYNTAAFKKLVILKGSTSSANITTTLSKAGDANAFDIRIYGKNHSNDYPTIDDRALVYEGIKFLGAAAPSTPSFHSPYAAYNQNKIKFDYKCEETENTDAGVGGETSDAVISVYDVSYFETRSRAYNNNNLDTTTENTDNNTISPGKNENDPFEIELTGLKPGTEYEYKVRAKNDLSNDYSAYSTLETHTSFTRVPTSNSIATTIDNGISNSSKTSIRGKGTSANVTGSQIYINVSTADPGKDLIPNKTVTQTFEITKPYSNDQHTGTTGYGEGVDGSSNLVVLTAKVGTADKQTVSYGGFPVGSFTNSVGKFVDSITHADLYGSGNNQNFRLKGQFKLKTIINADVKTEIGDASKNPYVLNYHYDRHVDVGGSDDTGTTHNIYIDDLSGVPTITYTTHTVEVKSVKYTMGIASVKEMEIKIERAYSNCNSEYRFIKGDGKVGEILAISKTDFVKDTKTIAANDITDTGNYTHTVTDSTVKYTSSYTNGLVNSLTVGTNAYNLVGTTTGSITLLNSVNTTSTTLNHFYDHESYASSAATTSELNLSSADKEIYQLDSIAPLGSNIAGIGTSQYTDHSDVPSDHTLLYIGGKFQGNKDFTYPDTISINYDNLSPNTCNLGSTAYALDGTTTSAGTKYKWIAFDIKKSGASAYKLYGSPCTITAGSINIVTPLTGLFSGTVLTAIFSSSDEAVCFVKATKTSGGTVMATPQGPYSAGAPWVNDGTGTINWSTLSDSGPSSNKYKCGVGGNSIAVDQTAINDLQIFIGVKN
jgi:hypothetical protein